ncbi:MAG: hypothetical protein M5T61_10485 [Acidimicrobiia bacterium]|nr:hypothetical protein [Acidimicrobiia bacterium]
MSFEEWHHVFIECDNESTEVSTLLFGPFPRMRPHPKNVDIASSNARCCRC